MPQNLRQTNSEGEKKLSGIEADRLAEELKLQIQSGQISKADSNQISLMIAGLADQRGLVRRTFTESLGKVGQSALPFLQKALLDHSNVTVRRAAAKALRLVGEPRALPDLLQALINDPDHVVQGSAAGAIASFGEKGFEFLIEVLINPKSTAMQCGFAKWGLSFIGAEAPKSLLQAAESKHAQIREAAIAALSEQMNSFGDKDARNILLKALSDSSQEVRAEATTQISQIEEPNLITPLLIEKLSDKSKIVRKSAVLGLMRLGDPKVIQYLNKRESIEKEAELLSVIRLAKDKLLKLSSSHDGKQDIK